MRISIDYYVGKEYERCEHCDEQNCTQVIDIDESEGRVSLMCDKCGGIYRKAIK